MSKPTVGWLVHDLYKVATYVYFLVCQSVWPGSSAVYKQGVDRVQTRKRRKDSVG